MSVYMTEQEQLEAIKKWWHRHQTMITVIVSIMLLLFSCYKYWNWHQEKVALQASNTFERMMLAFSNQDNKSVRSFANQLIQEYSNTVYADVAHLTLAKLYATNSKYQKAKGQLDYVTHHATMPALQHIAKIRMARLLIAEKSYDAALQTLDSVNDTGYSAVVNELKGDIFAATGRYPKAIASYRAAIEQVQTQGMGNLFLEMKTNELAALTQAVNKTEQNIKAA